MSQEMVLFWAPECPGNKTEAVGQGQRSLGPGLANSSLRTGHLLVEIRLYRHSATLIRLHIVCGCVRATNAEWSSCNTVWPAHPKHHLSGSRKEKLADPWSRQINESSVGWKSLTRDAKRRTGLALVVVHCVILKHRCKPAQLKFSFTLFWGSNVESKIRSEYSFYVTWTPEHCSIAYIYNTDVNVISPNFKKDANVDL